MRQQALDFQVLQLVYHCRFLLLALETLIFGFSTIIFLFAGIGALISGLLMTIGIIPETWVAGTACFGISTGISSTLLWKPFQRMQNRSSPQTKQSNDFEGIEFNLESDISPTQPGRHRYSGIDWKVELDAEGTLNKGERVVVVTASVGVLRVKKA